LADPATQFQPAGLNVGYQYTPVETRLNAPIQLQPVDYSGIGKAATEGLSLLMNSPINPAVREKMKAEAASYKETQNYLSDLAKHPERRMLQQVSGPTSSFMAGAQGGAGYASSFMPQPGQPGYGGAVTNQPTTNQPTTTNQPVADTGQTSATSPNQQVQQQPSTISGTPISGLPSGTTLGGGGTGQPPAQQPPTQAVSPFQSTQVNAPSVDQFAQARPQQQQAVAQTQAPSPVGDMLMRQWQDQNAHPVAPASEALKWAKNNFDTRAQDATYMPHGGPMGQPAYAFHMKGGGTNMVPLSQMVQNGFAGNVAGNQTSMTLSAADQVRQQGQAQQPQPQPQQIAQGQQQPPPQAPGGAVAQTPEQQQYLAQQTQITTPGGQPNPALAASTDNQAVIQQNLGNTGPNRSDQAISSTANPSNYPTVNGQPANVGQPADQATMNQINQAGDISKLPDGPDGTKLAAVMPNGIKWFRDPNEPSGMAFVTYNTTPWSQMRMYTNGQTIEHQLDDRLMDKAIYSAAGYDSRNWTDKEKVNWLRQDYWNKLPAYNIHPEQQSRLESLFSQVINSQRLADGAKSMNPGDYYSWWGGLRNAIASHRDYFNGTPLESITHGLAQMATGGTIDPRRVAMETNYKTLMGGAESGSLTPGERAELANIKLDGTLPQQIETLNKNRIIEYNRTLNDYLANHVKMDRQWLDIANQLSANGRIHKDTGQTVDWTANPRANPTPVPRALPVTSSIPGATSGPPAAPTAPTNNNQASPVDLSRMSQSEGLRQWRTLPKGTWVRDSRGNVVQVQ
jgi:hypothetical protein